MAANRGLYGLPLAAPEIVRSADLAEGRGLAAYFANCFAVPGIDYVAGGAVGGGIAGRLYYGTPFSPAIDCVVNTVAMSILAAAAATLRWVITEIDPDTRQPTNGGVVTEGTFDPSTTGMKISTSLALPLRAGKLYTAGACANSSTVTWRAQQCGAGPSDWSVTNGVLMHTYAFGIDPTVAIGSTAPAFANLDPGTSGRQFLGMRWS